MATLPPLHDLFPGYQDVDRVDEWNSLKKQIPFGTVIEGTIVGKSPFGAWIDFGVGFPGLLEIILMSELQSRHKDYLKYLDDTLYPLNSKISAKVGAYDDRNRQIRLWQISNNLFSEDPRDH